MSVGLVDQVFSLHRWQRGHASNVARHSPSAIQERALLFKCLPCVASCILPAHLHMEVQLTAGRDVVHFDRKHAPLVGCWGMTGGPMWPRRMKRAQSSGHLNGSTAATTHIQWPRIAYYPSLPLGLVVKCGPAPTLSFPSWWVAA